MSTFRQTAIARNLRLRARLIATLRGFFTGRDYLEVETPIRIPAPAPEAHIDPEPAGDWFLQTSPELCMKRLLSAGYPRIFQICRCFRRRERGGRHLPEMTLCEWYAAGADYRSMMDECEALLRYLAETLLGRSGLTWQGHPVDLAGPWERLTVEAAFSRYGGMEMEEALARGRFDEIMGLDIEPRLGFGRPVILYDYPAACGALARKKPDRPDLAERFEAYVCGLELCNAFSELTDPAEQRRRFEAEIRARRETGKPVAPLSEPFLRDLAAMPPATGNALGVDRLVMLFADAADIDAVVAFTPEEL